MILSQITLTPRAALPSARALHRSVVLDGKIYVTGGLTTSGSYISTMEIYDPASNSWSTVTIPLTAGERREHTSVTLDGKIYLIGGLTNSGRISTVDVYDPVTGLWSQAASLNTTRSQHSSVVLNGSIYVIGGYNGTIHSSVEVYNATANSWSYGDSLLDVRYDQSSHVLNDIIYVVGGYGYSNQYSTVEVYDPNSTTGGWSYIGNTPYQGIDDHTSTAINGKYYLIGGRKGDYNRRTEVMAYDPLQDFTNPFNTPDVFSNAPNLVIPDNATLPITTGISVSGTAQTISSSLVIDIELRHTWQSDLLMTLTSPSNKTITLWGNAGGSTDNVIGSFPSLNPGVSLSRILR